MTDATRFAAFMWVRFRRSNASKRPAIVRRAIDTLGGVDPTLFNLAESARIYDLAQPYFVGMPHHPSHPPYLFSLTKKHGDMHSPAGNSSAADAIAMGSHVGTHIDGFGHFSCG